MSSECFVHIRERRRKKKRTCRVRTSNSLRCKSSGFKVLSLHGNELLPQGTMLIYMHWA